MALFHWISAEWVYDGWSTLLGLWGGWVTAPNRSVSVGKEVKEARGAQALSRMGIPGGHWRGSLGSLQARGLQEGAGHPWTGREDADKDKPGPGQWPFRSGFGSIFHWEASAGPVEWPDTARAPVWAKAGEKSVHYRGDLKLLELAQGGCCQTKARGPLLAHCLGCK